jgi:hypothetical protein
MDARVNRGEPDGGGGGGRDERGRRALQRLRLVARLFDQAFAIPGTRFRFGLDALFGLIPGLGDIAGAMVAVSAIRVARMLGAPPVIQLHLISNIALDALLGMVPVLGDLFDFAFKAQTRNLALLDRWVAAPHKIAKRSRRGLLLIPLTIIVVFATLSALAIWMLYILFRSSGLLLAGL